MNDRFFDQMRHERDLLRNKELSKADLCLRPSWKLRRLKMHWETSTRLLSKQHGGRSRSHCQGIRDSQDDTNWECHYLRSANLLLFAVDKD
jgi:hypothetical protein